MNYHFLYQHEFTLFMSELLYQIYRHMLFNKPFTKVVGIANGGLHISQPLATILNIPHEYVTIKHQKNRSIIIGENTFNRNKKNERVLVVDDLIDTGETMRAYTQHFGIPVCDNYKIAVLYYKYGVVPVPDFFIQHKPDRWVVFPWETIG